MEVTRLIVQLLVRREKRIVFALLHLFESFVPSMAVLNQALQLVDRSQVYVRLVGTLDEFFQHVQRRTRPEGNPVNTPA